MCNFNQMENKSNPDKYTCIGVFVCAYIQCSTRRPALFRLHFSHRIHSLRLAVHMDLLSPWLRQRFHFYYIVVYTLCWFHFASCGTVWCSIDSMRQKSIHVDDLKASYTTWLDKTCNAITSAKPKSRSLNFKLRRKFITFLVYWVKNDDADDDDWQLGMKKMPTVNENNWIPYERGHVHRVQIKWSNILS